MSNPGAKTNETTLYECELNNIQNSGSDTKSQNDTIAKAIEVFIIENETKN